MIRVEVSQETPLSLPDFFAGAETHFIYPTGDFLALLSGVLEGEVRLRHLAAWRDRNLVGYLPFFIRHEPESGSVANALPYFGTNGSLLTRRDLPRGERLEIKQTMLGEFDRFCAGEKIAFSCVITSPFDDTAPELVEWYQGDFHDHRIGQITPLGEFADEEQLRRAISHGAIYSFKKGRKLCELRDLSLDDLELVEAIHREHMAAIHGTPKSRRFFEEIFRLKGSRVRGIFHRDRLVAFIIFIYYRNLVNYYTLGYTAENHQVEGTAYCIYQTMQEALAAGYEYFDFGGTWENQDNIYRFKRKYAARDYPYHYLIREYQPHRVRELGRAGILNRYPGFYVLPFDAL